MGNDNYGERIAVLETKIERIANDIAKLQRLSLQDIIIFVSVIGTLTALIAKGMGWVP